MLSRHEPHIRGPAYHQVNHREVELVDSYQYLLVFTHPPWRAECILAETVIGEDTAGSGGVRDIQGFGGLSCCQVERVGAAKCFKGANELLKSFTHSKV